MDLDVKKLGLKCGLEVHQQLNTGKLFCRCPSELQEAGSPELTIKRKLRPVASEYGTFDPAALEQYKRNFTFAYEAFSDSSCLVELDEEPVKEIDSEALHTSLEVSTLLKSKIMDELIVMRKSVIDGSNPSAFQRTTLIALGGEIEISNKKIGILGVGLEEDAGRVMGKNGNEITYRLDRQGIPLIEVSTAPDIQTPEEAKEAALKIGEIFRITGRSKRGLGTIRQDVNISIANGSRVELKGIQELELIGEYVLREAMRQKRLLELKEEFEKRKLSPENFKSIASAKNMTELFRHSPSKLIQKNLENQNNIILGMKLAHFSHLLGWETQPGKRFGSELAAYVKVKTGLQGLLHSDELPNYGITMEEVNAVKESLQCSDPDAFILVLGPADKCSVAMCVINERIITAFSGVPEETRNAIGEGNTEYSRPLPGASRLYPETDAPKIHIEDKKLKEIQKNLPLFSAERKKLYMQWGLSEKLAEQMCLDNDARFFESLVKEKLPATTAAVLLLENLPQLKRESIAIEKISRKMIEELLKEEHAGKVDRKSFLPILKAWSKAPTKKLSVIVSGAGAVMQGEDDVQKIISSIVQKNSALVKEKKDAAFSALMGDVMKELKGKASGAVISKILKEEIQKLLN